MPILAEKVIKYSTEPLSTIVITAPTGGMTHGEVYAFTNAATGTGAGVGSRAEVMVAAQSAAGSAKVAMYRRGIFRIPKPSNVAFAEGGTVQGIMSGTVATGGSTTSGHIALGAANIAAACSASYVEVRINEGPQAFYMW